MNFNKFLFTFLLTISTGNAVKLSIYYESLCPDSVRFILYQLVPTYLRLEHYLKLEFIPYGKASHQFLQGKWMFECQHGYQECRGNRYQACELAGKYGDMADLKFVSCVMGQRNPSNLDSIQYCANQLNLDWQNITGCANSRLGDDLLAMYGDKTDRLDPGISFVPTIVFDDNYDDWLQENALKDLLTTVCSKILEPKPSVCEGRQLRSKNFDYDYNT